VKSAESHRITLWDTTTKLTLPVKYATLSIYELLRGLPCGSLVEITGYWDNYGFYIEKVEVLHRPVLEDLACIDELPRDPVEFTRRYYLYVRNSSYAKVVKTYSLVLQFIRSLLVKNEYLELPTVIIGHTSDPGLRGASKAVIELYGGLYEVQSSVIMYKQLYASVFGRIFYTARNLRIEPPENVKTGRHLVEFTQVDIESAEDREEDLIRLAEIIIYKTIKYILSKHSNLLDNSRISTLDRQVTKPPYPRLTYEEAIQEARRIGYNVKFGEELSFEAEKALAQKYETPIWILHFPTRARGFYYIEDHKRSGFNVDYNLLLPGGYGEVLDGGCREYRYEKLLDKIKQHGEDSSKYSWFLELTRAGLIRPTCGWAVSVIKVGWGCLGFIWAVVGFINP
jgi:asparaginyl-tRNA synthetase